MFRVIWSLKIFTNSFNEIPVRINSFIQSTKLHFFEHVTLMNEKSYFHIVNYGENEVMC